MVTEFEGVDVDSHFPYQKNGKASYRSYQKEAIMKALTALVEQDYDVFFLDAPVGHGKSADLVTIARVCVELGYDSYYTTPLIVLQEQLKEFEDVPQIKGRSNFVCLDDPEVNCSDAECQVNESYKCPFWSEKNQDCIYLRQRIKCQESPICGMNVSYLMTVRKEVFDTRFLYMCDEAHSVPEWAVGHTSVSLRESDLGMIPVFDKGFEAYVVWLEKMIKPKYKMRYDDLKERVKAFGKGRKAQLGLMEEFKSVKNVLNKISILIMDYMEYEEDWIWNIVDDIRGKKIIFQPLTSGRFLDKVLWSRGEKVILSSGTMSPEIYIEEGGLDKKAFDYNDCVIEVPSDFPPEKSPIYYKPIGKLTNDRKAATLPIVLKEIEKVIEKNKNYKGLIHCFSYSNLKYVVDNIRSDLKGMLWVQDQYDRVGSLEKWMKFSKPSVFISVNMTEGLSLNDDLARYQIYMKVGYPNTQDKRVAKRLELNHWVWYSLRAIEDLEQSSGRATRSKDDWSGMYIFDASFGNLYSRYFRYFKPWFKQRVVLL